MKFLQKIFHKHNDITEARLTYCKECGYPFPSLSHALWVVKGYKKTEAKNTVLRQDPKRRNEIRCVMGRNDSRPRRCDHKECLIIECLGKIRCLYCGNEPINKIQGNVISITHPKIQALIEDWRMEAFDVGILK